MDSCDAMECDTQDAKAAPEAPAVPEPDETHRCSDGLFGYKFEYVGSRLVEHCQNLVLDKSKPMSEWRGQLPPDLKCFHCCHPFDSVPVRYDCYFFCSWHCCKAHLMELDTAHNRQLLTELPAQAKACGHEGDIVPAPARVCLSCFGGPLSIEEFRSVPRSSDVRVKLLPDTLVTDQACEAIRASYRKCVAFEKESPQKDEDTFQALFQREQGASTTSTASANSAKAESQALYNEINEKIPSQTRQAHSRLKGMMSRRPEQ